MSLPEEPIRAKRDGQVLSNDALKGFVDGIAGGQVSDAQIGAFAMAVHFRGMTKTERVVLTLATRDSGRCLEWPDLNGPVLDKHSTGGVGDLVSLILAPTMAACGAFIPMITGRGLGHTGGTLDKLESIPGFNVSPSPQLFEKTVRQTGLAMTGQGTDFAPADGRMYAVRDVTATVDSIPLIVASILSKKLAAGLDALVLDIKTGNGAFLCERDRSRELTSSLVEIATHLGLPCHALITDMNQPLARSAGNVLEMREAIDFLKGENLAARLAEVVLALGSEMLMLGKIAETASIARDMMNDALATGSAAEHFARMVNMQGGPPDLLDSPARYLSAAPVIGDLKAKESGFIEAMDTRAIGMSVVGLGGGRTRVEDSIDHRVGLSGLGNVGESVNKGDPLLTIHAANDSAWLAAAEELTGAITVGGQSDAWPAVYERVT